MIDFTDINYAKLGREIYGRMTEEQRACVSIGMVPVEVLHSATETFKDLIVRHVAEFLGLPPSDIKLLHPTIKPVAIKEFRRNLVRSIFAAAEAETRMVA